MAAVNQEIRDKQHIRELQNRYSYAIDSGQYDKLDDMFTPDATYHFVTGSTDNIEALKNTKGGLQIWTDSSYVKNGITTWIHGWKKKGWKTAAGKPVKNQDLWMELDQLRVGREVDWQWVKGHSGHPGNEMADALANAGMPT